MEKFRREGHAAESVLSAPTTRASRIISDIRNLFNHPSFPGETSLTDPISSSLFNSTAATMQASRVQRAIIVRLPPSRSGGISHRGISSIGQGALTPRDTGSTLIDDQDSVIEAQSKDIFPGPQTSGPAGGFSLDDAASSKASGDEEPSAPVKTSRKKKRRRKKRKQMTEKRKRDKLRAETENEEQPAAAAAAVLFPDTDISLSAVTAATLTPPLAAADSPFAMATAPVKESTAVPLQNVGSNRENTHRGWMEEVSAHDKEIYTQIFSLLDRLDPDGSADQTEPAYSGFRFDYRDHGHRYEKPSGTFCPVTDWHAECQASSYPALEPHSRGRVDGSPLKEDTAAGPSHVTNRNKPPTIAGKTDHGGLAYRPYPYRRADGKRLKLDTPTVATHPTNKKRPYTTLVETYHDRPARLQEMITEPCPRGEVRASRLIEETFASASHPANKSKPPIGKTDHERPVLTPRPRRRLADSGLIDDTPAVLTHPVNHNKPLIILGETYQGQRAQLWKEITEPYPRGEIHASPLTKNTPPSATTPKIENDKPPTTVEESDHERLARLERITLGLVGKRQQQPLSLLWGKKEDG
ncbi:MAG: hypothetical protein LQ344_006042 [Seirophora lacunosa]|nr:MAG: hypothetical protein LQ344_006042 [Seirophora lacunosa]